MRALEVKCPGVCDFGVCMLDRYVEREIDIYCYAQHVHEKDMHFKHMSVCT